MLDVTFYACMAFIFAASVPIWRWIGKRFSQKQPIIEPRQQLASPIGFVDLAVMLFVWALSQVLAAGLYSMISGVEIVQLESLDGAQMMSLMLIAGIGQLIAVAIGMVYLIARYSDARVIGWYPSFTWVDLKLALNSFLLVAPVVLVVQLLLSMLVEYKHPAMEAMVKEANAFTIAAVWVAAVIAAPIAEEVVFRGWIQNWLQRVSLLPSKFGSTLVGGWPNQPDADLDDAIETVENVLEFETDATKPDELAPPSVGNPYAAPSGDHRNDGAVGNRLDHGQRYKECNSDTRAQDWIAIVATSIIFAMMHIGQGLAPIPLFGLSLLLGYLYQRTGSLLPCIGLHMLNNGYSVFWLTMQILFGDLGDLP